MVIIPKNYMSPYGIMDTERVIELVKDTFETTLACALHLTHISAPLFVRRATGLNDDLNGVERLVSFEMKDAEEQTIEIIHSLAKWRCLALKRYGISLHEGIYTDMNAIHHDETLDNAHSIYIDQWGWEEVIAPTDQTSSYLQQAINQLYNAFLETEAALVAHYPKCKAFLSKEVTFISSQKLENRYPTLLSQEREEVFAKEKGAIFIIQIRKTLRLGRKHNNHAPDYNDWRLNSDLTLWNPMSDSVLELSSMGIHVDEKSLADQLQVADAEHHESLDCHQMFLRGKLPLTIGGGIGQSCTYMLLMQKAHIGEVQASIWTDGMLLLYGENGIQLL